MVAYNRDRNSNRFDNSVFNEVRPTYVGPPIDDLEQTREYLTKTARDNRLAQGMLDSTFADSIAKMGDDEEGVAMILQHKKDFQNALGEIISTKNMSYAGPTIQKFASNFAGDYRIKGRQKLVDEYNGYVQAFRDNKELTPSHAAAFIDGLNLNKLATRDDERGIYRMDEPPIPFKYADVNKAILQAAGSILNYPNITSINGMRFKGKNGFTNNINEAVDPNAVVTITTNGVEKEITQGELSTLFRAAITSDPNLRGYLVQDALVKDYYNGGANPVDVYDNIYSNEGLLNNVVNAMSDDFANSMRYKQRIVQEDIKTLNLYNKQNTEDRNQILPTNPVEFPNPTTNSETNNTTKEKLNESRKAYENTVKSYYDNVQVEDEFGGVNTIKLSEPEQAKIAQALESNDIDKLREIESQLGISMDYMMSTAPYVREARSESQLAKAKEEVINSKLIRKYPSLITPVEEILKNANVNITIDDNLKGENNLETAQNIIQDILRSEEYTTPTYGLTPGRTLTPEGKAIVDLLEKEYPKKDLDKYNKDYKNELAKQNKAANSLSTTSLPIYTYKAAAPTDAQSEQFANVFSNLSNLRGMSVIDEASGKLIENWDKGVGEDLSKLFGNNMDNISVYVTDKPVNGSSKSFRIVYKTKALSENPSQEKAIYVPIGVEYNGVSNSLYEQLVRNNPMYEANNEINRWQRNNIENPDGFRYQEYPNVLLKKDGDKITYAVKQNGNNVFSPATKGQATEAMAEVINNRNQITNFNVYIDNALKAFSDKEQDILNLKNPEANPDEIKASLANILKDDNRYKELEPEQQEILIERLALYLTNG